MEKVNDSGFNVEASEVPKIAYVKLSYEENPVIIFDPEKEKRKELVEKGYVPFAVYDTTDIETQSNFKKVVCNRNFNSGTPVYGWVPSSAMLGNAPAPFIYTTRKFTLIDYDRGMEVYMAMGKVSDDEMKLNSRLHCNQKEKYQFGLSECGKKLYLQKYTVYTNNSTADINFFSKYTCATFDQLDKLGFLKPTGKVAPMLNDLNRELQLYHEYTLVYGSDGLYKVFPKISIDVDTDEGELFLKITITIYLAGGAKDFTIFIPKNVVVLSSDRIFSGYLIRFLADFEVNGLNI